MLNSLFILFGVVAIVFLLVEAICTAYIGIYGVFTICKNCVQYLINPKFRQACKESNDKQFILKAHNSNEF